LGTQSDRGQLQVGVCPYCEAACESGYVGAMLL
jgi:hypothetical protein